MNIGTLPNITNKRQSMGEMDLGLL